MHRPERKTTTRGYSTFVVPVEYIIHNQTITLVGANLATYLVCCQLASQRASGCQFDLSADQLSDLIGYSVRQSKAALLSLRRTGHIISLFPKNEPGQVNKYEISSPITQQGLAGGRKIGLRHALMREQKVYQQMPEKLIEYLPSMKGLPLRTAVSLMLMARNLTHLNVSTSEWTQCAGAGSFRNLRNTFSQMDWLAEIDHIPGRQTATILLKNPDTGRNLRDEAEEREDRLMEAEIAARQDRPQKYPHDLLKQWIKNYVTVCYEDSRGQMVTFCPRCNFHKPTLSISVEKGDYGVFYCNRCQFGTGKYIPHLMGELGHDVNDTLNNLEALNTERTTNERG